MQSKKINVAVDSDSSSKKRLMSMNLYITWRMIKEGLLLAALHVTVARPRIAQHIQPKKNENISNRWSTRKTNGHITWKFNKKKFKERSTH
jgi:hypothetical protein